jgi:hypothetical protein
MRATKPLQRRYNKVKRITLQRRKALVYHARKERLRLEEDEQKR